MTPAEELALLQSIISGISAVITAFEGAKSGSVDPTTVLNAMAQLQTAIAGNNTAADTALDSKFPNG